MAALIVAVSVVNPAPPVAGATPTGPAPAASSGSRAAAVNRGASPPTAALAVPGDPAGAPGTIVAFAGSQAASAGNTGDGGPATAATFRVPQGMARDAKGNLYIADFGNNRVRKVRPDGTIVNFAGSPAGTEGFRGDGGPATEALVSSPRGVAVDAQGNVYFSEKNGNRVRKVDVTGVITTFAGSIQGLSGNTGDGGAATAATFDMPAGLAFDKAGNLYVADQTNDQIRKIDARGIITNFAGCNRTQGNSGDGGPATAAELSYPAAVAVDGAGTVYIADEYNHRIRVVNTAGTITNFAGDANYNLGNTGDGGPALSALLSMPAGIAVDAAGNVYIGDAQTNRVRRVDPGGTITNFAGADNYLPGNIGDGGPATAARLTVPDNLVIDGTGNIVVEDAAENRIREVLGPLPYPEFTADSPPTTAATGHSYSYRFAATGVPSPAFAVAGGTVPPGLTLDATTGVLAGTPSATGHFIFSISAANGIGPPYTSPPVTITVAAGDTAPAFSSPAHVAFADTLTQSFRITTTGYPTPTLAETGLLPTGVTFTDDHDGTATVAGAAGGRQGGVYQLTLAAANGIGSNPTQTFTLTVNEGPGVTAAGTTFTVGAPAQVAITTRGYPVPAVSASGTLPPGITFDAATRSLSGAPAQGTVGTYAVTFTATNSSGPPATEEYTITVNQAVFAFPYDGESIVTVAQRFRWTGIPQAQGYWVVVGTFRHGANLANSGMLAPTASSVAMPAFPVGPTLYATLLTEVNGAWTSYQDIAFTTAPGGARLTNPLDGSAQADTTRPILWQRIDQAEGYWLVVGTHPRGSDLVNSGPLPPDAYGYQAPILPAGKTIYATLLTSVNGAWSYYSAISYSAQPEGGFTHPLNGQLNVVTPGTFAWTPVAGTQLEILSVGTTYGGDDVAYSGNLSPGVLSFDVPQLPPNKVLYATLITFVSGNEAYQVVAFTAGGTGTAARAVAPPATRTPVAPGSREALIPRLVLTRPRRGGG